ncbi:MAG: 2-C-methyl-D-erythritol 2,4-cyclodiphosphate synthase [Holophagales bacterium]|nr:2-C-methyl-D-erythritol 2,4-cyclodiphosphate synthase [Holophagales bacterium]
MKLRVGQGFDVHRLVPGRRLVLGGVEIPFERGLDGHSDADVVIHALCDALLGAAGLEDIGHLFPPSDPAWRGAAGRKLLSIVMDSVRRAGFSVVNCDLTVVAEVPKIAPYREAMKEAIAGLLGVEAGAVGLKATTNERLGALGREEGVAAFAVVLLERGDD